MIDYKISKNARILFVGINPHPGSYRRGVPFSNNKMFWYLLNRAGLLQEAEKDLKNDQLLKGIYDEKFLPEYGLNFVNLVDRPTIDVTELKKGEKQAGVRRVLRIIRTYRPKVVCFIGKIAFNTFYNSRKLRLGLADGNRRLESLSDAFSNPGPGGDPRERIDRSETSRWRVLDSLILSHVVLSEERAMTANTHYPNDSAPGISGSF